jgi:hypothetical protein
VGGKAALEARERVEHRVLVKVEVKEEARPICSRPSAGCPQRH